MRSTPSRPEDEAATVIGGEKEGCFTMSRSRAGRERPLKEQTALDRANEGAGYLSRGGFSIIDRCNLPSSCNNVSRFLDKMNHVIY